MYNYYKSEYTNEIYALPEEIPAPRFGGWTQVTQEEYEAWVAQDSIRRVDTRRK